ncbi:DUF2169 family type VI secretion system accessory protein [Rahnella selenatireducens]|uniref:DUF2169 family type VI secretion system accessory protein n=1 Tax=Rahnella selenatireducens TaxID=3389797 RepID=UPI003969AF1F
MEFRNLTPFAAMQFMMRDREDNDNYVVIMKVGYRLEPDASGGFRVRVRDDDAPVLSVQDEYLGEMNMSSVIQESDLAPFKPYCDIIISGSACADKGSPVLKQTVSVKINNASGHSILEKKLTVNGKRNFLKNKITKQWSLKEPEPFIRQPVIWEAAFGGECRINESDDGADSIPKAYRLTDIQKACNPDSENLPLAHSVCENNPLGKGFITPWYARATQADRYPAPQITDPRYPFTAEDFESLIAGRADSKAKQFQPAGLGFTGRAWLPRRQKAGTYDEAWLKTRHPGLPADFDYHYWNAAPADQQIPFPKLPLSVTLQGFSPEGAMRFSLPAHEAFVLLRMDDGMVIPREMNLDTLHIAADSLDVTLCWRFLLPVTVPVRVIEARYETGPDKLLEKLFGFSLPETPINKEVPAHG